MDNKKAPYGPGEEGAVASVHDDGTVVVDWDRGPNYPPGWSRTAIGGSGSAHHHARGSPMGSSLTRCSASRRATSPCEATTTWCARASKVDASGWSSLTTIIARLSVEEGLPRLTPHGLRHSFATAALRARVPVEVVAARLGNTPAMVQQVYSHVIPADDQAAAQLMGDLYRRDVTTL
jgi:hypothetical protein